jgi:thymidine kinase
MAQIHIYTGPMASGKTTKLLEKIHEYSNIYKKPVLLINYRKDDRGISRDTIVSNGVSTHTYGDYSTKVPLGKYVYCVRVNTLSEIEDVILHQYSVIGIDEAQFYPDLELFIRKHHLNSRLRFYISGLTFTAENKPFGQLKNLEDISTTYQKFNSICSQCNPDREVPAGFTSFIGGKDTDVVIGGLDVYEPLCALHYFGIEVKN